MKFSSIVTSYKVIMVTLTSQMLNCLQLEDELKNTLVATLVVMALK